MKEIYSKILGVRINANKQELKRAYRKKVMLYHPDKNPTESAKEKFIAVQEAYEYLSNPHIDSARQYAYKDFNHPKKSSAEDQKEKRFREAKERYKKHQAKKQAENDAYYSKISSGKQWTFFKLVLVSSLILAFTLVLDQFLPNRYSKEFVTKNNVSMNYGGLNDGHVSPILTSKGKKIWLNRDHFFNIQNGVEIYIEESFILREVKSVNYFDQNGIWKSGAIDFSIQSIYIIIVSLLMIPLLTLIFKGKTLLYSFLFLVSVKMNSVFLLFLLISNNRGLHLITLGYL